MVVGELGPNDNIIIVKFSDDPEEQKFEVRCTFKPYDYRIRKYSICDFWIKWKSEQYIGDQGLAYRTHLVCERLSEHKDKKR
ncbi:hypothetical protein [uncultured Chryseobacterium sp.]|uniref:hypothetical protein n=1 Tax=uncultured Chryseobacterium sp. TaxID=259322 RepID=UPI0025FAC235|nr:hypothetical protein [uncultured Chryseobacterium sp.]